MGTWTWESPLPQGLGLSSIWAIADDNVYAAGGAFLHYDGTEWTVASTGLDFIPRLVWASTATDVLVSGDGGQARPL